MTHLTCCHVRGRAPRYARGPQALHHHRPCPPRPRPRPLRPRLLRALNSPSPRPLPPPPPSASPSAPAPYIRTNIDDAARVCDLLARAYIWIDQGAALTEKVLGSGNMRPAAPTWRTLCSLARRRLPQGCRQEDQTPALQRRRPALAACTAGGRGHAAAGPAAHPGARRLLRQSRQLLHWWLARRSHLWVPTLICQVQLPSNYTGRNQQSSTAQTATRNACSGRCQASQLYKHSS